jgi:hypothetical protein
LNSLYIIRIINRFSIAFGLLQFIFASFSLEVNGSFLFLFAVILTYLAVLFKDKRTLKIIFEVALLLPAAFYGLSYKSLFTAAIFVYAVYIIKNINTSYESFYDEFNTGIKVIIVFFLLSFISQALDIFNNYSAGYIIIYIITSVITLRTLRLNKFNQNNKYAERSNLIYSVIISSISAAVCLKSLRVFVFKIIAKLYDIIVNIFMYIFSWFFYAVGYLLTIAFNYLWKLMRRGKFNPDNGNINIAKLPNYRIRKSLIESFLNTKLVNVSIKILVIFAVFYILLKIFLKKSDEADDNGDYIENREFIKNSIKPGASIIKRMQEYFNMKSCSERIRYYYRKFLKMCMENKVDLKISDTTQEINKKSELIYNKNELNDIRDIYINVRYGENEADNGTLKKFKEHLNRLKK